MKAVLATEIGTRVSLRICWGNDCPNCVGCGSSGYHNAQRHLFDTSHKINGVDADGNTTYHTFGGDADDYPSDLYPLKCDHCDAIAPTDASKQIFNDRLYDTSSGKIEPGCLYWAHWYPEKLYWDNHNGPMLMAKLPNGGIWNIDSRASNCTMPDDRLHRCWVRNGEPPIVHIDKNGHTCAAGAGSILCGDYHGFLHNGEFTNA